MKREEGSQRKVRSDKKREIQPIVSIELYETISRLSYIATRPIKDVGESICMEGLKSKEVIDYLSTYFRRGFFFSDSILYPGDRGRLPHKVDRGAGNRGRISLRFHQDQYDRISELAYALDMTASSATALLLEAAIKKSDIIENYMSEFIEETLDEQRLKQLNMVLRYLNKNNPYQQKITLTSLIDHLFKEFMESSKMKIKHVIHQWLDDMVE